MRCFDHLGGVARAARPIAIAVALGLAWGGAAHAASGSSGNLLNLAPWHFQGYFQNNTQYRFNDQTGDTPGFSRMQNTLSLSFNRGLFSGWRLHGTLRGSYNAVYDVNPGQYGTHAGHPIRLQGALGNPNGFVPWGQGLGGPSTPAGALPPGNALGFNATNPSAPRYNPNVGLHVLGERWHPLGTHGVELGAPVRPCNVDSRGCANFGGYGDEGISTLRFPEFNRRLDFLRALYLTKRIGFSNGQSLFLKVGRQQVVWGRTDLFRVLDVINPVDYSRNNIYDPLEDMRYPLGMINAVYDMGPSSWLQDANIQVLWILEPFRPNNLGQCGQPNVILNAGCTFRALKSVWDYGGTVANFAGGNTATDFGPHQIGIRNVYLPDWKLSNTQIGLKFGGVSADGQIAFSLNWFWTRSQLPSLHSIGNQAVNPFTGCQGSACGPVNRLIAFDMYYPRIRVLGGSLDYQWNWAKAAVRFEGAYISGQEFTNTLQDSLYSTNHVGKAVIGIDRPTFIPFISGNSTTLISAQLFYQHIFGFQRKKEPLGYAGMVGWQDNVTATLLLQGTYMNGRLHPTLIFARDFRARADVISPQIIYAFTNNLTVTVGANLKDGGDLSRYTTTDCRACNPYPPFTGPPSQNFDAALSGIEPLGIFKAGPIGAARRENQVFLTVRQSF